MQNKFQHIPEELRNLKFWIVWRYEDKEAVKPTKVPYSVKGYRASVTEPNDWASFDEALNCYMMGGYDGLGFIFDNSHPYAFIDLDDTKGDKAAFERQLKVSKEFDSYSEVSPSGQGLHIIVKGSIPQGRRRSFIEIYSHNRYATMTGEVYTHKPIADRHELLNQLFNQMGGPPTTATYNGNEPQEFSDEEILAKCSSAANGDKFNTLFSGEWKNIYSSQSEADFAIIDIIAFYTQNRTQITRIFQLSQLGKRDKAKRRDYIESMVLKSFDKLALKTDFDGFRIQLEQSIAEAKSSWDDLDEHGKLSNSDVNANHNNSNQQIGSVAQRLEPAAHNGLVVGSNPTASTNNLIPPPGLVGDIARFIYEAAPRPVPEIAIAGAMGLMAGICGRAYNISGTGLNQYILCLAMTGAGKEAIASGIDKIVNAVQMSVPVAGEFIGPSRIASGQALYKYLSNKSQCFVSIIGEFGKRLDAMSNRNASSADKQLISELLDLYNKSGFGQTAKPSIYSDQDKNTVVISSPAFTILGESTPDTFYNVLNEEMIADGLLPRFMLIEYKGGRPEFNENAVNVQPSFALVERISHLMASAKTIMANRKVINIERTEAAGVMLKDFDKLSDAKINSTDREVIRQLWNRAHIKVLKIAGLIAVGIDYNNPIVDVEHVVWAKQIVENDIKALSHKFEKGEIGKNSDELKQIKDMKKMLKYFVTQPYDKVKANCKDERLYHAKIIPMSFLSTRLYSMASFKNDKVSQNVALKRTIQYLVDSDIIREASKKEMIEMFGTTAKAYVISRVSILYEDDD